MDRLPAEYKALEARVDGLREVHQSLLKITKVHETETVSYVELEVRVAELTYSMITPRM
jgi:hypothetical protein